MKPPWVIGDSSPSQLSSPSASRTGVRETPSAEATPISVRRCFGRYSPARSAVRRR